MSLAIIFWVDNIIKVKNLYFFSDLLQYFNIFKESILRFHKYVSLIQNIWNHINLDRMTCIV